MIHRRFLAATALSAAMLAAPAAAQQIYYEDGGYLYAVPAPAAEPVVVTEYAPAQPVTARRVIPARTAPAQPQVIVPAYTPVAHAAPAYGYATAPAAPAYAPAGGYTYGYQAAPAYYGEESYSYRTAPAPYGYSYGPQYQTTGYLPGGGQLVAFDREAWLAECRARIATYDEHDRGKAIGAIGGAIAGGIIGNRVAGSGDRLAGTAIGAGAGALAGGLIGDAIDDRSDARASRGYCEAYLDDYMARAAQAPAPTSTVAGQQYMLVPVTVPVAQHRIYTDNGQPVR